MTEEVCHHFTISRSLPPGVCKSMHVPNLKMLKVDTGPKMWNALRLDAINILIRLFS